MFLCSVNQFPTSTFRDPRDFSLKYHFSQTRSEMFITGRQEAVGYFLSESANLLCLEKE